VAYRVRLAPDYAGGGFYAATGFGFVGSTQLVFSDFLGDHNIYVATDVFTNSLEETNALAVYNYLPGRWDFGVGLFHFKNYFASRVTQLGENFGSPKLFSDRSFGGLVSAAYPFDRFRRIEFNVTQMFVDRQFFDESVFGTIFETEREFRSVTSPSVSLVGDNALFGYYGPVNGARYNLTYAPSLGVFRNGLEYQTVTLDTRRYWDMTRGYTFAGRVLAGVSGGPDAQAFRVGGFSTLRGFEDFEVIGDRVAIVNAELRFPFIQQLGLVGPVPIGIFNLRGAVFSDAGLVWNEGDPLKLWESNGGGRRLVSPKLAFGTGIRTSVFFLILKLDTAWTTDLQNVSRPRWHFSIGPEF
jgi:outer membrane protein assembly factor BamA